MDGDSSQNPATGNEFIVPSAKYGKLAPTETNHLEWRDAAV
jgi:hypothetical protein